MLDPNSIEYALDFFRRNFLKRKFEIVDKKFLFSQDAQYYNNVGFRIVIATERIANGYCEVNNEWDLDGNNRLVSEISGGGRFQFSHHGNRLKTVALEIKRFIAGL